MNKLQPTLDWLENPEVFAINRLSAHSDHHYYTSLEKAYKQEKDLKLSLNGSWKFAYAKNPQERAENFYEEGFDTSSWDTIQVPGHIQMQGYGHPHYTNTLYPWDGIHDLRPSQIPMEDNPVGSYWRSFERPSSFEDKRVILDLEGVETACYIWVNGAFVGYSEDSFTPSLFDLTNVLKKGINTIAIEVYRYSSASWIEDQDFWRFSGIFRDVNLYAQPALHVEDLFVKQSIDIENKKAQLAIDLTCRATQSGMLCMSLKDAQGQEITHLSKIAMIETMQVNMEVENIHLWSAEDPYLYTLYIEVYDATHNLIEVIPQTIGLRDFRMEDGVMKINGKRIVFHGINRHEFHPKRGRSITKQDMEEDIRLLKRHNVNAVRTSHYPNQSYWYELCDRYGIYLIDETNLESHGSWQKLGAIDPAWNIPGSLPQWKDCVIDRANSMLQRDKNHASVIIWSCGNESYAGENFRKMHDFFHEVDPSRIVHYEGVFWNREFDDASDMESRMYAKVEDIIEYLKTNPKKPYISCEFSHAMGNSLGNIDEYVALEQDYSQYQGGFIWDYVDQAIEVVKDGKPCWCYGGDFFDQPTDYNFCGDGVFLADRRETGKSQEMKQVYRYVDILPDEQGVNIANHYLFSNLEEFSFRYEVKKEGLLLHEGTFEINVDPDTSTHITIPWGTYEEPGEYTRNVYMHLKNDNEWGNKTEPMCYGQQLYHIKDNKKQSKASTLKVVCGDGNIGVYKDAFAALFMTQKGMVTLRYKGIDYLKRIPAPTFWRAPTDNEIGLQQPLMNAGWLSASLFMKVVDFSHEIQEDYVCIHYTYELSQISEHLQISYQIYEDTTIKVHMHLSHNVQRSTLSTFGMKFTLPMDYQQFTYYGRGPQDTYIDRMNAMKDVYTTGVQDSYVPYLNPQECGNHVDVNWCEIRDKKGNGLRFTMQDTPMQVSALPYTSEELMLATHTEELPTPYAIHLRILMAQMGVGGDDSWGAPIHDAYHIKQDKDLDFHFFIAPIQK